MAEPPVGSMSWRSLPHPAGPAPPGLAAVLTMEPEAGYSPPGECASVATHPWVAPGRLSVASAKDGLGLRAHVLPAAPALAPRAAAGLVLAAALASGCLANVTTTLLGGRAPVALAVLDANADGRTDLAVLDGATHTVQLLTQEDGGSLARAGDAPAAARSGLRAARPRGRDRSTAAGRPRSPSPSRARIASTLFTGLRRRRDGPTSTIDFGAGAAPSALAVARLERDGYADLLVGLTQPGRGRRRLARAA